MPIFYTIIIQNYIVISTAFDTFIFLTTKEYKLFKYLFLILGYVLSTNLAFADGHEAAEVAVADPGEISFVFNTLLFCIGGFLVMWMAAGFTMLEVNL